MMVKRLENVLGRLMGRIHGGVVRRRRGEEKRKQSEEMMKRRMRKRKVYERMIHQRG